jgi:hypothetical protein
VIGFILFGMNAIDRAGVDAGGIFGSDARFCYYVGHGVKVVPGTYK